MSTISEQLREALEQTTPIDVEYSPLTPHGEGIKAIQDLLPSLLDEHEKLEREVERLKEFEWKYNDLCK